MASSSQIFAAWRSALQSGTNVLAMQGVNAQGMLTGASALGTDLRHDHPISFVPVTGSAIV